MAELNFPLVDEHGNPIQAGAQHTGDNGVTYIYDGYKWTGHAPTLSPGTNSLVNNGQTAQINSSGNFVLPAYTFPNTTATSGQTLVWPNSGTTLQWATGSGGTADTGNIRFTSSTIYEKDLGPVVIKTSAAVNYWWSEYGDFQYDSRDDWGAAVEYDSQGNVYVVGGTYHNIANTSTNIQCLILKYGVTGELIWQKTLQDSSDPYIRGEGLWIDNSDHLYVIANNDDNSSLGYLIKLDSSGNIIWQVQINISPDGNSTLVDIDGDNQGHVYITSSYNYVVGSGHYEPWVACFNTTDGSCVWQQYLVVSSDQYWAEDGYGIAYGNGSVYITGDVYNINVENQWDLYIAKLSAANGSVDWVNQLVGGGHNSYGTDVAVAPDGNIYVVGTFNDGVLLVKFDISGAVLWKKIFDVDNGNFGTSLDFDSSNIYVTAQNYSAPETGNPNFLIMKFDNQGNLIWQRNVGGSSDGTYQYYYNGHKEIAVHTATNTLAVTGYTYVGTTTNTFLNSSNILTIQIPLDGSLTGTYGSFDYKETSYTVADSTLTSVTATFIVTATNYSLTTSTLYLTAQDESAALFAFSSDSWKFGNDGVLTLPAGGDLVDHNTGYSLLNNLRSGAYTAQMDRHGVLVDENNRSITGELNTFTNVDNQWGNMPIGIRHATGYIRLFTINGTPQTWLDLNTIAAQAGVDNANWITGMILEFQAMASGNIVNLGYQISYMTGQIIIANSGNSRMSITHSETAVGIDDSTQSNVVWTGLNLWVPGSNIIQVVRTDVTDEIGTHTLAQLDIQWTARVFTNPAGYWYTY